MRRTISSLGVLLLALGGLAQGQDVTSLQGKASPDLALKTLDGKQLRLSDQKGKVVLLDMWATWCPPCRKSLPHLQMLSVSKPLADKGLVVWAVNQQESPQTVREFLLTSKNTFTILLDADGTVGHSYLVTGIPTTVVVGRDGTVKSVFVGFGDDSPKLIDDAVDKALAEK